jgi:nucleotide-binding universal stress UspA family protein
VTAHLAHGAALATPRSEENRAMQAPSTTNVELDQRQQRDREEPDVEESMVASARFVFERIFVPVDYTRDSQLAVGVALELQRAHGSQVCLFHAAEGGGENDFLGGIGSPAVQGDWVAQARERLRRFLENVAPDAMDRLELRAAMDTDDVLRMIHDEARTWGASLLVVAAPVHRRLLHSKAERIVHDSEIPTLVIPIGPR